MCGISGIVGRDILKYNFDGMYTSLEKRGPDITQVFKEFDCVLAHNRLSIIDLSDKANQPFYSKDKRYVIVFNGAIYNYLEIKERLKSSYIFDTESDTEVLLAAFIVWGRACLGELNGMFSFVIWDSKEKELFAARDRFGVKPFYYSTINNTLLFASEIKGLFNAGIDKKPKIKVWANYFKFGSYGSPDETFWEGVHQLQGGHFLTFSSGNLKVIKWYHFEDRIHSMNTEYNSIDFVKNKLDELLENAIKLRFRADVPIGFNLSGGLDSSTLLYYVNNYKKNENIKAFSFYCNDERYDELYWVEKMIKSTDKPLIKILLSVKDLPELIKKMSLVQDEPYGGFPTIAYAKIFKEASRQGIKVLLDGQGMDEQLAGYDYYNSDSNSVIQGTTNPFKLNMLSEDFLSVADERLEFPAPFSNRLQNMQYRDLFFTKIPRALRFNDRISMYHSTELREPFLDYNLVEFNFSLPKRFKIQNKNQKFILRDLMREKVSKEISYAPKRALQTPQREWLQNELSEFVKGNIVRLKDSPIKEEWFNFKEIDRELRLYKEGNISSSFHLWQLINLATINFEN